MNRFITVLTIALLAASLANVGCDYNKVKKELAEVQQLYHELDTIHQQTQANLVASAARNRQLQTELDSKDAELAVAKSKVADLEGRLAKVPDRPDPPEGWEPTATGAKLTLAGDVLFSAGRATLSRGGAGKIKQAARTIKSQYPKAVVRVYGFSDSDRIKKSAKLWTDNLDLSANRAMAVTRQLWKLGVPSEMIETIGMGATHFVASNRTSAGKAKNRRVEIVVVMQ